MARLHPRPLDTDPGQPRLVRLAGLAFRPAGLLLRALGAVLRWLGRRPQAGVGGRGRPLGHFAIQLDGLGPAHRARLSRYLATAVVALSGTAVLTAASIGATAVPAEAHLAAVGVAQQETVPVVVGGRATTTPAASPTTGSPRRAPVAATKKSGKRAPLAVVNPATRGALPVGKGMWIWQPEHTEGNNIDAMVARAKAVGLTHLYVRTGSTYDGFYASDFLNRLLPAAHASGLRVFGWDVPYLKNADQDVARAVAAITYTTPDGQRLDGFSADIERGDGQNITPSTAGTYGAHLRSAVGAGYPLVATVPRPNPALVGFPFAQVVEAFDAIAPMVYWMGNEPGAALDTAVQGLAAFGKPIIPVGQAYDGFSEGGPRGVPSRTQLLRFFATADAVGAPAVSFWDWQEADQQAWDAIRDAPEAVLPAAPAVFTPGQVRAYQTLLTSLGFRVPVTGVLDSNVSAAIAAFQRAAHLPVTGRIDEATRAVLLTPKAPPTG